MKKDLAYIKLISGEYVIGEVAHNDENTIVLKKPLSTKYEMMVGGLQMFPYDAFYLNRELDEVIFKKDYIMHIHENEDIPEELKGKYNEFASGLIQPQKPDLSAAGASDALTKMLMGAQ
jgi:hypothetical protein